jgi:hypothetical protein
LTRQPIIAAKAMDPRVKPAGDDLGAIEISTSWR